MRMRVIGGAILIVLVVALLAAILYKAPSREAKAGVFEFIEFREIVWIGYGLMILILAIITSIVLIASVFTFRVSEEIGG